MNFLYFAIIGIVAGWLAGVLGLSIRLLVGWLKVQRLRRSGAAAALADLQEMIERLSRRLRVSRPVRVLESASRQVGESANQRITNHASPTVQPFDGPTDLFIYPGYEFRAVDVLITNFHLPRSTLLMLVAAFASKDLLDRAYAEAIRERYRFYSFGDAMLILACKGRHQHQQRRARQVKVGDQHVRRAELVARVDEEVGISLKRLEIGGRGSSGGRLEDAHTGGAHRDHAISL